MKLAIMQPYLFPYIGYFQLMNAVDEFVIYDNIQFSKKGWINRNRILVNGRDAYITLPLKKGSDYLDIKDRYVSDDWSTERKKLINKIAECYRKAPQFNTVFPVIEKIIMQDERNLFQFIYNSLQQLNTYLSIKTPFIVSSTIDIDHQLKSEKKVTAICKARQASIYVNPIGGVELYNKHEFAEQHIELQFLKADNISYQQFANEFIPYLSIIDVLMFNDMDTVKHMLNKEFSLN